MFNYILHLNNYQIQIIFFLLIPLILTCKEDMQPTDCGCSGPVQFTIEDSDKQSGYLFMNDDNSGNNVPDYNYGIWFDEPNCSNCIHRFLVCNDNFLSELQEIPNYPGVQVLFSGTSTNLCKEPFKPADETFNHIILTKLELQ